MSARICARRTRFRILGATILLAVRPCLSTAAPNEPPPPIRSVTLASGIELRYVEKGAGPPVVFVHGSLSFGGYWSDQIDPFARAGYRVVDYSRRYNFPNANPIRPGYSAITDADDLAGLIGKLGLGRVNVVGHSYGALAALFLAVRHPRLVRTLVLAEAPAVSLLNHLPGNQAAQGRAVFADIQERMVEPMKTAFRRGDREAGVRTFLTYVLRDPQAWDEMSPASREETMRNAREWDAMLTTGEFFPSLEPANVRRIRAPALLLSGEKSYPFLALIDEELLRLLPHATHIVFSGASHAMWIEQPEACRKAVLDFLRENDQAALADPQLRRTAAPATAAR